MARNKALLMVMITGAFLLPACTTTSRSVASGPALTNRIGLPVYPHDAKLLPAHETVMSSSLGTTTTLSQSYETSDSIEKVRQFYEQRLPASKRVLVLPLGSIKDVTLQFTDKSGRKQVTVVALRGVTFVTLQSTTLSFAPPTSAASAGPTASR